MTLRGVKIGVENFVQSGKGGALGSLALAIAHPIIRSGFSDFLATIARVCGRKCADELRWDRSGGQLAAWQFLGRDDP
jgi:hypothetical protein